MSNGRLTKQDLATSLAQQIDDTAVQAQNLGTKTEELATQLAQKALKEEVRESTATRPINVSEMDTETKQLFTGGAVPVVGVDAVGTENLKSKSITVDKTDFIKKVDDGVLVDTDINNIFTTTGALNPTTGVVSTGTTTSLVSDFIDLTNVEFIFRYINDGLSNVTNTAHTIGFFDANKTFISSVANVNSAPNSSYNGKYGYKYTNFPINAKFARINVTKIVFEGSPTTKYNFLKVAKTFYNQLENDANSKSIETINAQIGLLNQKIYNLQGKKVAVFGDSIMEFGNIPETISQLSGATVYDCSVGGTRMARHTANTQGALYNELCMYRLANYINTGNYTGLTQATESLKNNHNDDNTANMNTLKSIDWSIIDIVIIAFGTNDYHGNNDAVTIGTDSDMTSDGSTFKGALNYAIDQLLSKYPNLQIVLTTPIYRHRFSNAGDGLNSDVYANDKGLYLKDYADAIKQVASIYHLPVIDLYSGSGINKYTYKKYLSNDELHPSAIGYSLLGRKIAKFENSIPTNESVTLNSLESRLKREYLLINESYNKIKSANIYDKSLAVDNAYVDDTTGTIGTNRNWAYSGKFPVEENTKYTLSIDKSLIVKMGAVSYWGSDGTRLSVSEKSITTPYTFITPVGTTKISVNITLSTFHEPTEFQKAINTLQVEKSAVATPYKPFTETLELKQSALDGAVRNMLYGKRVLAIGDSLTWLDGRKTSSYDGGNTTVIGYQEQFRKAGATVTNMGNNGATYCQYDSSISDAVHGSIYDDIVTNAYNVAPYDVFLLCGGTNDVGKGYDFGTIKDYGSAIDPKTTLDAIRGIIEYIFNTNPNALIYVFTPPFSTLATRPKAKMLEVTDKLIEQANNLGVFAKDTYRTMGMNAGNIDVLTYDKLHFNNVGMEKWGKWMVRTVESN